MRNEGEAYQVQQYTGEVRDGQLIVHGSPRLLGGITCIDLGDGAPDIAAIVPSEELAMRDIDLAAGGRLYGGRRLYLRNHSSVVTTVASVGAVVVREETQPQPQPQQRKPGR